jgi:phosphoglycolate phosphatase-like HAD superfamily hydrolase
MSSLAIFDIDGTLTNTTAVDDDCYRSAVAEALGIPESTVDWTGTPHFTDRGIFDWLFDAHARGAPTQAEVSRASHRLAHLLDAAMTATPARFEPIPGARGVFDYLRARGWSISVATGCWRPSARLKLRAAGIPIDDALIACSDDAAARTEIVSLSRARAVAYYGHEFTRVVSIGDGIWDVEAAAELGLPFVGVGHGERRGRLERAGASVVIENYSDRDAFTDALAAASVPGAR